MKRIDKTYFEVEIPHPSADPDKAVTLTLNGITEAQAKVIEKALHPGNTVYTPAELEAAITGWAVEAIVARNRRSTDKAEGEAS